MRTESSWIVSETMKRKNKFQELDSIPVYQAFYELFSSIKDNFEFDLWSQALELYSQKGRYAATY